MNEAAEEYDFSTESFDGVEFADEATRPYYRPIRPVSIPGALSSATLHTPRGPATLNLPAPVATLAQFRALEQAVNASTQRINVLQASLARATREVAAQRRDQQSQVTSMMMFSLLTQRRLRDDLTGHTHNPTTGVAVLPAGGGGGGGLSSFLPFIFLMQPGGFGGSATSRDGGGFGGVSPLLFALLFLD